MTPAQSRESYRSGWSFGVSAAGQSLFSPDVDDREAFNQGYTDGRAAAVEALRLAIGRWPDGGWPKQASDAELRAAGWLPGNKE